MSVNTAHLRAFHTVATESGFTTAARALGVTQPTVSSHVKALEERYGLRLLDRSALGVTLTPMGGKLFELTQAYFSLEEQVEELLSASRSLTVGALRVGGDGPHHVIPALARFAARYPGVDVSVHVGNADAVMAMLAELRLDVAVMAHRGDPERFHAEVLTRSPLVLFVAATHPWARREAADLGELAGQRVIHREARSETRRLFEAALAAAGVRPAAIMEIESREAVREAVAAGLGVGVVAAAELDADARLRALAIRGVDVQITEYVVCLKERSRLAVVQAFRHAALNAGSGPAAAAASVHLTHQASDHVADGE